MEIRIWVRRTLDWSDPAHVEAKILPAFRSRYELWNDTFALPYASFRARLKGIAEENLKRVAGASLGPWEDLEPGRGLVIPIDDDDWLAPDLAAHVQNALESQVRGRKLAGVYWAREVVGPPRRRRSLRKWLRRVPKRGRFTCYTNNYAVAPGVPDLEVILRNHVRASEAFDAHPERFLRIPALLAIQNRNLASQTALGWRLPEIDEHYMLERYQSYRLFYASWRIRRELRWAQPCIDAMAELMDDLSPR